MADPAPATPPQPPKPVEKPKPEPHVYNRQKDQRKPGRHHALEQPPPPWVGRTLAARLEQVGLAQLRQRAVSSGGRASAF